MVSLSVKSLAGNGRIADVPQAIHIHTFANGLTLLAERMEHVRSAAVNFLIPAGCAYDPPKLVGIGSVLAELITRGAGSRDSRALSLAMDNLGLDRSESVGQLHVRFWGGTLARNIPAALELYADVLRRPHLPDAELEPVQALLLQDLQALEDEPRGKVMVELRRRRWPEPLGRDRRGTPEGLQAITPKAVRAHYKARFGPRDTILSVAGNIEWEPLRDQVERLFGDWQGGGHPRLELGRALGGQAHLSKDTTQTQIALAYPSVPFGAPDYYAAQGAVQVLSGGMGARLFTEVREKRGLCYSVYASYQTFKDRACVLCYAGTTNDRAQETLDVTMRELRRLEEGVEREEVERVQAGLKSSVIMQEESTSARAGALASEWYYLGRVRPLEEIQAEINSLTPDAIVTHARKHPPRDCTVVTLGPTALQFPA
jgi:predicted Zn-dependent peptidase